MTTNSTGIRTLLAAGAAALALTAAACGNDSSSAPSTVTVTQSAGPETSAASDSSGSGAATTGASPSGAAASSASTTSPTTGVDAATALAAALDAKPGSYAVDVDEEGRQGWEVTVVVDGQAVELTVDATGAVTGERATDLDREDRTAPAFSASDAVAAATAAQSGDLDSLDLDTENGTVVWEATVVDAGQEHELRLDASTGGVLQNRIDD